MLRLVLGSSPDEKLNMYAQEIRTLLDQSREVTAIVPDQFSFEFDRILYQSLGAKDFNRVSVISFRKLADELITRYGAKSGTLLKREERTAVIYLALKNVKAQKKLNALARSLDKPAFVSEISVMVDRLIRSATPPEALSSAAKELDGSLSMKLCDIGVIYEAYLDELKKGGFLDESSTIALGAELAKKSGYFKGKQVYIDRFDSYSNDELAVIEQAIVSADNVSVSITLPANFKPSAMQVYSVTAETQNKLVDLAARNNVKVQFSKYEPKDVKPNGITAIDNCLLNKRKKISLDGSVTCVSAANVYEEMDYVAAQIRRLVMSGECSFNDIALITRNLPDYQSAIESAFERYDIPVFIDGKTRTSDTSVMLYCFAAISAACTKQPSTDKILQVMCSAYSGFNEEEISCMQDYCVRWNIEGNMWLEDFTAECDDIPLERLNAVRKKAIEPIRRLYEATKNADAKTVASAFNRYIEDVGLARNTKKIIDEFTADDEKLSAARFLKQVWEAMMNAVAAIYSTIGDRKLKLKEFGELLRLMLSDCGIANPPQKLLSVSVCDVSRSIIYSKDVVFVIGLNDGKFPLDAKKTGIFNGRDSVALERVGIKFEAGEADRAAQEMFMCYRALSCAAKKLYITYSTASPNGTSLRRSYMLMKLDRGVGLHHVKAHDFSEEFYCSTEKAAFYRLCVTRSADELTKNSIRAALECDGEYRKKLAELESISGNNSLRRLTRPTAKKLFAPRDVNITASRIDVYNRCNFRYFMKYGLDIKDVTPMAVDPANRGSVMHYVFQTVLEHFGAEYQNASDEDINAIVAQALKDYKKQYLGEDFGKSKKFEADYMRLHRACVDVLVNIREEYKVSLFRPVSFEYNLSAGDGESILSIPINKDLRINIRGVVDRVDTFTGSDGKKYIRIIDYKTGSKTLRFEDIYNGLNLQMLLYMLALTQGKKSSFKDFAPAGVLYMKAGFLKCDDDYSPLSDSAEHRLSESAQQLKRSGLIIGNDEVIAAMDENISGTYLPVTRLRNGEYSKTSSLITPAGFERLERYAKDMVEKFGSDLLDGKIDVMPVGSDKTHLECAYCEFSSVCDRRKYMYKLISKDDSKKLEEIILKPDDSSKEQKEGEN